MWRRSPLAPNVGEIDKVSMLLPNFEVVDDVRKKQFWSFSHSFICTLFCTLQDKFYILYIEVLLRYWADVESPGLDFKINIFNFLNEECQFWK